MWINIVLKIRETEKNRQTIIFILSNFGEFFYYRKIVNNWKMVGVSNSIIICYFSLKYDLLRKAIFIVFEELEFYV